MGNEIMAHSWNHDSYKALTKEQQENDLLKTADAIEKVTGVHPYLFRPPYGDMNGNLEEVAGELGYAIIIWSSDTRDWALRNANAVYNNVLENAGNRDIVCLHDLHGTTVDAMEMLIPELVSRGYQLVTVSELMYYTGKTMAAGKTYFSGW
jgi:peptidoglycan/xylan/chitin deacetylase (PgdA/CDA1 family)